MKLQTFIFGLVLFSLVFYDAFRVPTAGKQLFSFSIIALVAGILFESIRLTDKWMNVLYIVVGSLMGSFFFTIHSDYSFENDVQLWPYMFIFVFSIASVLFHDKKLIPKLTEGITLIQSIAVIYWVIDKDFLRESNLFVKLLMFVGLLFSAYSAYHALVFSALTETKRFVLSIWSSIIMVLFALNNIFGVFYLEQIENVADIYDKFYIGFAYFFLGISTIYIIKNSFMLLGFFPD